MNRYAYNYQLRIIMIEDTQIEIQVRGEYVAYKLENVAGQSQELQLS